MTIATRGLLVLFMVAVGVASLAAQGGEGPRRVERRDTKGRETDGRRTEGREGRNERAEPESARVSETERAPERDRATERGEGGRGEGGRGSGIGTGGERRITERSNAVLTPKGYEHIVDGHGYGSSNKNAGKFSEGTSESRVRQMVNEATLRGKDRPNTNGRDGTIYEHEFQNSIGVDSRGNPTSRLRVVVSSGHEVITAFPY